MFETIKIWSKTKYKLKVLASVLNVSLVSLLERLVNEEMERQNVNLLDVKNEL